MTAFLVVISTNGMMIKEFIVTAPNDSAARSVGDQYMQLNAMYSCSVDVQMLWEFEGT